MLLSTYALLTLTVEQKCERMSIQRVQDCLAQPSNTGDFDCAAMAVHSEELILLAESRHQCRLENSLFPALREASREAAGLLRQLEYLGRTGRDMLPALRSVLRPGARASPHQLARVGSLVQAYCQNLLDRLACEEDLLLPMAQRLLRSEAWFRVGTEFLMQDARRAELPSRA